MRRLTNSHTHTNATQLLTVAFTGTWSLLTHTFSYNPSPLLFIHKPLTPPLRHTHCLTHVRHLDLSQVCPLRSTRFLFLTSTGSSPHTHPTHTESKAKVKQTAQKNTLKGLGKFCSFKKKEESQQMSPEKPSAAVPRKGRPDAKTTDLTSHLTPRPSLISHSPGCLGAGDTDTWNQGNFPRPVSFCLL